VCKESFCLGGGSCVGGKGSTTTRYKEIECSTEKFKRVGTKKKRYIGEIFEKREEFLD